MNWTQIPSGQSNAASQRLMVGFGDKADEIIAKINTDPSFLKRITDTIKNEGYENSTSQTRAREIMGKNMFGIEEAGRHFGVEPSQEQLVRLARIPCSEAVLSLCMETHILVASFPLCISDIRKATKSVTGLFREPDKHCGAHVEYSDCNLEWCLIRKTKASSEKEYQRYEALLSRKDENPRTNILVYAIMGHFLATGERLFENETLSPSDPAVNDMNWKYLGVSPFLTGGLCIAAQWSCIANPASIFRLPGNLTLKP